MITPGQLDEIQKRCHDATPGSWERDADAPDMILSQPHGAFICEAANDSNATFIAHARDNLPDCIEEIRRLNKENLELNQANELYRTLAQSEQDVRDGRVISHEELKGLLRDE